MSHDVALFQPLQLGPLEVRNRAWVSPMCQYSCDAQDGVPVEWHRVHYGSFALGGWGLVLTESTAVSPEARISPWDTGLWNEEQVAAWRTVTDFAHAQGTPIGVQLGHAGRKASTNKPWIGWEPKAIGQDEGGWRPVGPTTQPGDGPGLWTEVDALDEAGIQKVVDDFRAAAERAGRAGFDAVEVHGAHGYLLHQFLSPLSNTRTDAWGGSLENRARLLLAVVDAIREVFDGALLVRLSATDWDEHDGIDVAHTVQVASMLKEHGVHLVDVSSGGLVVRRIPVGPLYQVGLAEEVRREAGVATSAVGIITTPEQAERVVSSGQADAVMLAREALRDINWPLRAAHELGVPPIEAGWPPARDRAFFR